ncbi:uncharacterized protein LOC124298720 isoform X2 [Neodiprion virginianus]|uniref:uncharacterized protein LOC124298720 isoform X2 n=1 Tax=Neodiprion virginianus TaxID=2961670 RepID=UPI001EE6B301|nr:uncharacterized protein LOC124298720 isoform X2 [Neodiprion virginianus]
MRVALFYPRRFAVALFLVALVYCVIQALRSELGFNDVDPSNTDKLAYISQLIKTSAENSPYIGDGVAACRHPDLELLNPEIMKFIKDVPPLECTPEDWVIANRSTLVVTEKARQRFGPITCAFKEIIRVDDYTNRITKPVESDVSYTLKDSDYAEVNCQSQTGKQWHSVLAGVQSDPLAKTKWDWAKVPNEGLKLNVLMFGFDSLSRNTFIRKLPKSYRYLKQNLNALVLEGYNIVGDGTPQALIPILTGKIELELPETRKRMGSKANYVDVYPFVWNEYKKSGYMTGFLEDVPNIGTFTYRLKGFKDQPTDHYMRTYYLNANPHFKYQKKFCMGGLPRHSLMMNHIKEIFDTYPNQPKFVFGFHGELSHDSYNDIGAADDDVYQWIKSLNDSGHLNNTVLIMMSDHGHRFAEIRNTLQGKQEERLPFFSFTFPSWFKQAHPHAYANFVYNTQHLTTPFDVHKTLQSILKFETPKEGDRTQRAISLFNKIPLERTCADAFIEPHWCACLGWEEVDKNNASVVEAAKYFVKFLNDYLSPYQNTCEILKLNKILWAAKLIPTKGLLKFEKSGDADGFLGDFTAKTKITKELYQLKVSTEPGNGLFEVSINHSLDNNSFMTRITDISRINKYGSQARCIENSQYHLRKYCYCKDS